MKFLQLVCIEHETTDQENAVVRDAIGGWVEDTINRGINITGKPLDAPETAKTVRVRDGETLISDGPFADTKEFIGGFDLIECDSFEQAIEVAAAHPVGWFNAIELRRLRNDDDVPQQIKHERLRQMLLVCGDEVAAEPEQAERIWSDCMAWREQIESSSVHIAGAPIAPASEAKTVRRRDGETLVSDGPFLDTKEFVAGFDLLSCASLDEAVGWAAKHPIARYHPIEVRNFVPLEGA